ncbi:MAG: AIPR family protein [Defluviitaleaceae bacterium]|nr:AIPR family protein [Defluviitaleaceae bacterium]
MSKKLRFRVSSFKKFENPYDQNEAPVKYQFFVKVSDVPDDLEEWLKVNPRGQNLNTDVGRAIRDSLRSSDKIFHLLNRGICLAAEEIKYDNQVKNVEITLSSIDKHGIIDGGHTFKSIMKHNNDDLKGIVDKYVQFEVITHSNDIDTIADARNTSIPVNKASIEELRGSFEPIKAIIENVKVGSDAFIKKIAFKQNEFAGKKGNFIDVREIIAIINMFNPEMYDPEVNIHPIQSYSGKEAGLNKFINLAPRGGKRGDNNSNFRESVITQMSDIIPDIFKLWDKIELEFAETANKENKNYSSRPYSNHKEEIIEKLSMFSNKEMKITMPKGLMYPTVGAFRSLVRKGDGDKLTWAMDPFTVWDEKKGALVVQVMDTSKDLGNSPDKIGKSNLLWDSLYNLLYIHRLLYENKKRSHPLEKGGSQ